MSHREMSDLKTSAFDFGDPPGLTPEFAREVREVMPAVRARCVETIRRMISHSTMAEAEALRCILDDVAPDREGGRMPEERRRTLALLDQRVADELRKGIAAAVVLNTAQMDETKAAIKALTGLRIELPKAWPR